MASSEAKLVVTPTAFMISASGGVQIIHMKNEGPLRVAVQPLPGQPSAATYEIDLRATFLAPDEERYFAIYRNNAQPGGVTKVCLRYAQATDPAATDPKVVLSTALNRSIIGITAVAVNCNDDKVALAAQQATQHRAALKDQMNSDMSPVVGVPAINFDQSYYRPTAVTAVPTSTTTPTKPRRG